jgi:uncharacterized protein
MNAKVGIFDTLLNFVSGLGTRADKNTANQFAVENMSDEQLCSAYRGDWIAAKAIDIPAQDATRRWRAWQAKPEQITAIEKTEKRLNVRGHVKDAVIKARLLRGSLILIGVENAGDWSTELRPEAVKKDSLKYLLVVDKTEITPAAIDRDLLSPYYGQPTHYTLNSPKLGTVDVHPSRVVRMIGRKLPMRSLEVDAWGDSVMQSIVTAVKNASMASEGVASLIQEAAIDVLKIPGFMDQIGTADYKNKLMERVQLAQVSKSILRALMIDKEEEYEKKQITFANLAEIVMCYMQIVSGAVDIPVTRLLGQTPAGLSSTGESDLRNYYDNVQSGQENDLEPVLTPLDEIIIRSALGSRPEEVHYKWRPLWQPTPTESADITLKNTQALVNVANSALFDPAVLAKAAGNMLIEDGFLPGLEQALEEVDALDDVDEDDPEAKKQFNKSKAGSGALPGAPMAEDETPQDTAMNGAQITSLQGIVEAVAAKEMPPETAKAMIRVGFPSVSETQANEIIDPLANFEPPKPEPLPGMPGAPGTTAAPAAALPNKPAALKQPGIGPLQPKGKQVQQAATKDAAPRTLYVSRKVMNAAAILAWAKKQGIPNLFAASDLHVTITYSRQPVDWFLMGESWQGELKLAAGGPRQVAKLGTNSVCILFASNELTWRHERMILEGASWDYAEYQPHITVAKDLTPEGIATNLSTIEPYTGEIILGPEIFEEVDE